VEKGEHPHQSAQDSLPPHPKHIEQLSVDIPTFPHFMVQI